MFESVVRSARPQLRQAVFRAAEDLGVWQALERDMTAEELAERLDVSAGRLSALLDVLALEGVLEREGGSTARFGRGVRPDGRSLLPLAGWGRLAEVIRRDTPLPDLESDSTSVESQRRYQEHLRAVGREPAEELARRWLVGRGRSLLDLGGGTGAYTSAFLDADPRHRAVLVDWPDVVALARQALAGKADRVAYLSGDIESVDLGVGHPLALMSNLLHLHGEATCRRLVACAVDALAPGGALVVKDVRIEADRTGPVASVYFSLNMALYTRSGSVHAPQAIASWIEAAGLGDVEIGTLSCSPDAVIVAGRKAPAQSSHS